MFKLSDFPGGARPIRFDALLSQEPGLIHVTTIAHLTCGPVLIADILMHPADVLKIAKAAERLAQRQKRETLH